MYVGNELLLTVDVQGMWISWNFLGPVFYSCMSGA